MGNYVVRVVSSVDPEILADESVSETVLSDIDRLFSEICRNIVRAELRLQGDVPEDLYTHLGIDSEGALAHDARRFLDETLDYLGGPSRGTWMSVYPEFYGNGRWWLSTPGDKSYRACYVSDHTSVSASGESLGSTVMGVRPAIMMTVDDAFEILQDEEEEE